MRSNKFYLTPIILSSIILVLLSSTLLAQDNETIITIAMPEWLLFNQPEDLFSEFEAQHPGVKVIAINPGNALYTSPPNYDIEAHLDNVEQLASMADVIYPGMNTEIINPFTTRAGYFLDLSPLTASDTSLNADDFHPATWRAYQWDHGVWGLPVSVSPSFLVYKQEAFDNAGLSYPDTAWTIDDFAHAQRQLSQRDASGNVTDPGFYSFGNEGLLLLRGFFGRNFMAPGTDTLQPDFTSPELESLMTSWIDYQEEGLLGAWVPEGNFSFDMGNAALSINQGFMLSMRGSNEGSLSGVLLPGNIANLMVAPVAVSAGTQEPELAYELAKFLTSDIGILNVIRDGPPARRSLADTLETAYWATTPEADAITQLALENGLSKSDLIFMDYLAEVINAARGDDFPGLSIALEEAEQKALNDLQIAEARRGQTFLAVATPVPTPSLSEGQIAINFGINNMSSNLMNEALWNQVIDDFIASNPQIGRVTVKPEEFLYTVEEIAQKYDCFYLPFNGVPSDISNILSLDPFLDTDMNFDRNDFIGTVLQQVQRENRTWAYPIDLKPEIIWYHEELFSQAGVPAPENGWSISEFADALYALKLSPDDPAPFRARSFGSNGHLLMLVAAYGGLPFDHRTNPATINLTDPATIEAIRQVLDLAKAGYIEYESLSILRQSAGGSVMVGMSSQSGEDVMYTEIISPYTFQRFGDMEEYRSPYRLTSYPSGTQFTPVTYDIGTAYISATNENPEACYRWISTIAQNPALFNSVPAQQSNMNNAALLASTGADMYSYAQQFEAILNSPTVIEFPSPQNVSGIGFEQVLNRSISEIWFNDALDNYVLEEADTLEQDLILAEQYIEEYLACAGNIPPSNLNIYSPDEETQELFTVLYTQYARCAVQTDPSLDSLFGDVLNN